MPMIEENLFRVSSETPRAGTCLQALELSDAMQYEGLLQRENEIEKEGRGERVRRLLNGEKPEEMKGGLEG